MKKVLAIVVTLAIMPVAHAAAVACAAGCCAMCAGCC